MGGRLRNDEVVSARNGVAHVGIAVVSAYLRGRCSQIDGRRLRRPVVDQTDTYALYGILKLGSIGITAVTHIRQEVLVQAHRSHHTVTLRHAHRPIKEADPIHRHFVEGIVGTVVKQRLRQLVHLEMKVLIRLCGSVLRIDACHRESQNRRVDQRILVKLDTRIVGRRHLHIEYTLRISKHIVTIAPQQCARLARSQQRIVKNSIRNTIGRVAYPVI